VSAVTHSVQPVSAVTHSVQPVSAVTHSVQLSFMRILITKSSCISSENKMKELSSYLFERS
jgi:C1A family cysteine protease